MVYYYQRMTAIEGLLKFNNSPTFQEARSRAAGRVGAAPDGGSTGQVLSPLLGFSIVNMTQT